MSLIGNFTKWTEQKAHLHLALPRPGLYFSFTLSISNLQSFLTLSSMLTEMWNLRSPFPLSFSHFFHTSLCLSLLFPLPLALARSHTLALTVIAGPLFLREWELIAIWHWASIQQRWGGGTFSHAHPHTHKLNMQSFISLGMGGGVKLGHSWALLSMWTDPAFFCVLHTF